MNKRYFYQDFLFRDMPVDEIENPIVPVKYVSDKSPECKIISLDKLIRMNKESEWTKLHKLINGFTVVIEDDVELLNEEVQPYKEFYLKAYVYEVSRYCKGCFVFKSK